MPDVFSKAKRSAVMRRIRSKNTGPEIAVRCALHGLGFRFRLHRADLPGKPDIVLPKYRAAILVHGCFWHGHNCSDGHMPGSNKGYWLPKIAGNRERDKRSARELRELGWRILIIWECQAADAMLLRRRLEKFLGTAVR